MPENFTENNTTVLRNEEVHEKWQFWRKITVLKVINVFRLPYPVIKPLLLTKEEVK